MRRVRRSFSTVLIVAAFAVVIVARQRISAGSYSLAEHPANAWNPGTATPHDELVQELHSAQVAAVPKPLVIGGHQVCPATGDSNTQRVKDLDTEKNRIDIPAPTAYIPVAWNDMVTTLTVADVNEIQGAPVAVTGYLSHRINVEDSGTGESTNCHLLAPNEVDWHIYLTNQPNQPISQAVIVETTPRTRPLHHWSENTLAALVNGATQVRISGWLMYDWQHVGEIHTQRATVWEVHPITRIEVQSGGGWRDIEQP